MQEEQGRACSWAVGALGQSWLCAQGSSLPSSESGPRCSSPVDTESGGTDRSPAQGQDKNCEWHSGTVTQWHSDTVTQGLLSAPGSPAWSTNPALRVPCWVTG